jgi:hypothetical protein
MKKTAVCIRCGTFKKDAFASCKKCNLKPTSDFEAARALILSEKKTYGNVEIGRSLEELKNISTTIQKGKPYPIDGEEQNLVVREYSAYLRSLPKPKLYQSKSAKWIAAGLLLVSIVISTASVYFY